MAAVFAMKINPGRLCVSVQRVDGPGEHPKHVLHEHLDTVHAPPAGGDVLLLHRGVQPGPQGEGPADHRGVRRARPLPLDQLAHGYSADQVLQQAVPHRADVRRGAARVRAHVLPEPAREPARGLRLPGGQQEQQLQVHGVAHQVQGQVLVLPEALLPPNTRNAALQPVRQEGRPVSERTDAYAGGAGQQGLHVGRSAGRLLYAGLQVLHQVQRPVQGYEGLQLLSADRDDRAEEVKAFT